SASVSGAGTVSFLGGAFVDTGSYNISGSTTVSGGSVTLNGPVLNLGVGPVISSGGLYLGTTTTLNGPVSLNGELGGSGALSLNAAMTWTGGGFTGSGSLTVGHATVLTITGPANHYLNGYTLRN